MRNILLLAGSCVLALAGAVSAQPAPQGALFIAPMGEPFRGTAVQTGVQQWFAQADSNHDGKISLAEFIADADAFLPHADSNGDGTVTSMESTALWRAQAPEVISGDVSNDAPLDPNTPVASGSSHGTHQNNGGASWGGLVSAGGGRTQRVAGPPPVGAQAYGLLGDAEPIMSCDTNFDRRIEKTEFEQCAARRFVQLDANHDGFFTPDEVHPWLTTREHAEH